MNGQTKTWINENDSNLKNNGVKVVDSWKWYTLNILFFTILILGIGMGSYYLYLIKNDHLKSNITLIPSFAPSINITNPLNIDNNVFERDNIINNTYEIKVFVDLSNLKCLSINQSINSS